ncbi:MAG: preprotein translocase subunit SecA [Patescibacteria group bacterium]|nr:preprotein translocase subunit SecA [Patescibacteria group bacterium]
MSILEKIVYKIIGDPNEKELKRIRKIVKQVNDFEDEIKKLSDSDLAKRTEQFRAMFSKSEESIKQEVVENDVYSEKIKRLKAERKKREKEIFEQILAEALAIGREAGVRALGLRAYDVQIIGAIALHEGQIAEMKTGEGKTLSGMIASYLRALPGHGVHIVTVNEYLAERDKVIKNHMAPEERRQQYATDVTYGTNNEFGFDYLRDNMAQRLEDCVQREHYFAIVDEVDSILIDEARTPLIISAPAEEATSQYIAFSKIVKGLRRDEHYEIDEKQKAVALTEAGIAELEKRLGVDNIYTEKGFETVHHLEQALRAEALFQLDKDYVIQNNEILIVDEFTGRLMPGRRYSDGLHQALEAKEHVEIKRESMTLATITFQHYFRLYETLSGMTGTAKTEEEEFAKIYGLPVLEIPTNKLMVRDDLTDAIFRTEKGKFKAVVREIKSRYDKKQPVLVGTISIEKSEYLSELLKREGVKHEVLNAKNHAREAEIIANAGLEGSITIATNMAGRGTDIKIGGTERSNDALEKVASIGGLHILGTERHEARRIDNQLRGRAGRQGEPGSSQFFVSMDDDLMRIFGGDRVQSLMNKLNFPEDQPLEHNILSRSIESAQKRVEGNNFDIRQRLFEFDSVVNKHREKIYSWRRAILQNDNIWTEIETLIQDEVANRLKIAEIDGHNDEKIKDIFMKTIPNLKIESISENEIIKTIAKIIQEKLKKLSKEDHNNVLRYSLLRTIDRLWMQHIDVLSNLRQNVSLQAYGQRDPLLVYKKEAFDLFQRLMDNIRIQTIVTLATLEIRTTDSIRDDEAIIARNKLRTNEAEIEENADGDFTEIREEKNAELDASPIARVADNEDEPTTVSHKRVTRRVSIDTPKPAIQNNPNFKKVGRNDPCPCGSGKKFKKCCGR